MEDKLFCVLAIHNEEKYLPYSLQPLLELGCRIVVVLDRCSDSSELIIRRKLPHAIIFAKQHSTWNYYGAETKKTGCDIAKRMGAKLILISDADVILDVDAVKRALKLTLTYPCVVFSYRQYSLFGSVFHRIIDEIHNMFSKLVHEIGTQPVRYGIYIIRAENSFIEDRVSEYDYLQQKLRTTWVLTNTLHLRPRWDIANQMNRGVSKARLPQYNLLKVIITSFLLFQPFTLVGYLKWKIWQ